MQQEGDRPREEEQRQQEVVLNAEFGDKIIFPEDIVVEILVRLPVKQLLRLRCVCKSWCALIDDDYFIERHYEVQRSNGDGPLFSMHTTVDDISLTVSILSKQNNDIPLDLTADLVHDSAPFFTHEPDPRLFDSGMIVGVANGIVCFEWGSKNVGFWNPATRDFMALLPWQIPCRSYFHEYYLGLIGFGYDYVSKDFKIVRELLGKWNVLLSREVYSSATKSWKNLNEVSPLVYSYEFRTTMEAYFNNVCYWSILTDTPAILSFNLSTEVFKVFYPPPNAITSKMGYKYSWNITLYKEYLAFVVTCIDLEKAVSNIDVWVVIEFDGSSGIPTSWQHVLTLGPFPKPDELSFITFTMDGDVLFYFSPIEWMATFYSSLYNPSTGTFKDLGICIPWSFNYVESLFPVSKRLIHST